MADPRYFEAIKKQREGIQFEHRSPIALEQIADELHMLNGNMAEIILALKSAKPAPWENKS
jgi:hypothetical protein